MKIIETPGLRLASEAFGDADDPTLLLVMGATASMLGWPEGLCHALAARGLHVIRFDHRDTGASTTLPPGTADYVIEDMAHDILRVMDGYGLRHAHLAGMSLGGYLSQMVALTDPGRVSSLTLIAAEPLGWDGPPLPQMSEASLSHFGRLSGLDWADRGEVANFLLELDRLCAAPRAPFNAAAAQERIARVLDRTGSPASMFNHATLKMRDAWTGLFREIAAPVLVIHGAEDPILPPDNGRAIAAGVPDARLAVLPRVGHELPERVWDTIADQVAAHVLSAEDAATAP